MTRDEFINAAATLADKYVLSRDRPQFCQQLSLLADEYAADVATKAATCPHNAKSTTLGKPGAGRCCACGARVPFAAGAEKPPRRAAEPLFQERTADAWAEVLYDHLAARLGAAPSWADTVRGRALETLTDVFQFVMKRAYDAGHRDANKDRGPDEKAPAEAAKPAEVSPGAVAGWRRFLVLNLDAAGLRLGHAEWQRLEGWVNQALAGAARDDRKQVAAALRAQAKDWEKEADRIRDSAEASWQARGHAAGLSEAAAVLEGGG